MATYQHHWTSFTALKSTTIKGFIDRAHASRSGTAKSGGPITADSALWYVEAALNYSLANTALEYSNVAVDTITVSCALNTDGTVEQSEVLGAFNDAMDVLDGIPTNEQHLVVIDGVATAAGNALSIVCTYVIGSGYEQSLNTTYGPADDFMWWQGNSLPIAGCVCGDNPNPTSQCANYHIQKRINYALNGGYYYDYWTDIETWNVDQFSTDIPAKQIFLEDLPSPDPAPCGHSNQGYLIYYCVGMDCSTCLDEGDMAFHTQGTYDAMIQIRDDYVLGKYPISCKVSGDMHEDQWFHTARFTYGKYRRE